MTKARDKQRPRRPNATGRTDKTGQFVMLPHRVLKSAAYASLGLAARSLLQELVMIYTGTNNGSLWMSARDATARLGFSDFRPALRAFADLQDRGFVSMAKDAYFRIKASDTSRARCWRLSWHACPNARPRRNARRRTIGSDMSRPVTPLKASAPTSACAH